MLLNQDKTQYIWLGSRAQLAKINADSLRLRFPNMHFSSSVRDLGFILDPVLSLSDHVNSVSRSCFYYLRQLRAIRQSLPLHAITTLVHALICSRIDYGNAVYIGLPSTNTSKLQSILNAAACLIGGIAKFDHISYFIRDSLHWLPIRQRIQFKVCSLMRSCLVGSTPHYLRTYCTPVCPVVPPFGPRPVVTWLSCGCVLLRPSLGVLLLLVPITGTSYLRTDLFYFDHF